MVNLQESLPGDFIVKRNEMEIKLWQLLNHPSDSYKVLGLQNSTLMVILYFFVILYIERLLINKSNINGFGIILLLLLLLGFIAGSKLVFQVFSILVNCTSGDTS